MGLGWGSSTYHEYTLVVESQCECHVTCAAPCRIHGQEEHSGRCIHPEHWPIVQGFDQLFVIGCLGALHHHSVVLLLVAVLVPRVHFGEAELFRRRHPRILFLHVCAPPRGARLLAVRTRGPDTHHIEQGVAGAVVFHAHEPGKVRLALVSVGGAQHDQGGLGLHQHGNHGVHDQFIVHKRRFIDQYQISIETAHSLSGGWGVSVTAESARAAGVSTLSFHGVNTHTSGI